MTKTIIEKARRAYDRSAWAEVIRILEPMVVHNRDSFNFYRLLGLSCLRAGDLSGAGTYLRRAAHLSPGNEEIDLALAAIELRRRDMPAAVEAYLEILEDHPGSHLAKQALDFLRRKGDEESLNDLVDSGGIEIFYPGKPRRAVFIPVLIALLSLGLIFLSVLGIRYAFRPKEPRMDIQAIQLSGMELEEPIQGGGNPSYILTEKEAIEGFERCKKLFQDYRDNAAIIEANRLLMSNVSEYIKEKARQLKSLAQMPTFKNLKDIPSFRDVMDEPALHDGCAVIWKGRVANLLSADEVSRFDFLVGYHERKTLEGIIPAFWKEPLEHLEDNPVELLAWVRYRSGGTSLEVITPHDLSYEGRY